MRTQRREDGASAVEFALVVPLLLMLFFGIISFGIILAQNMALNNGAREGARYGVVDGKTCAQITATAKNASSSISMSPADVTVTIKRGQTAQLATNACANTSTKPCCGLGDRRLAVRRDALHLEDPGPDGHRRRHGRHRRGRRVPVRVLVSRHRSRAERAEQGAIALMAAMLCVVLFAVAAIAVDLGMAYVSKRQLQTAADAGVLAATQVYKGQSDSCATLLTNSTLRAAGPAGRRQVGRGQPAGQGRQPHRAELPGRRRHLGPLLRLGEHRHVVHGDLQRAQLDQYGRVRQARTSAAS